MTKSLHHMAFRCRDTEATRQFYEEVIGLPLVATLEIGQTATGRAAQALHTFFEIRDGSYLAFFEVDDAPFEFKPQHDFDLHIALEADHLALSAAVTAAKARGIEVRGPSDHGFIRSTYFRDPDGYVVELTVRSPDHDAEMAAARKVAHERLARWNARKVAA
jgi:catechol 2,3-dioxygenase-like lactoylglutathione lyase family enzyme